LINVVPHIDTTKLAPEAIGTHVVRCATKDTVFHHPWPRQPPVDTPERVDNPYRANEPPPSPARDTLTVRDAPPYTLRHLRQLVPAQQPSAQAAAWIPGAVTVQNGAAGACVPQAQGAQVPVSLIDCGY